MQTLEGLVLILFMSKSKILVVTTFLLFCTLMPLANAARNQSRFYVKIYAPPESFVGTIRTVDGLTIIEGSSAGWVTDEFGNRLGTYSSSHSILIIKGTGWDSTGWSTGQGKIVFNNGTIIEGIAVATLIHPTMGTSQFVDGKFIGHGDMNVMAKIENIEVGAGFALDGYSW